MVSLLEISRNESDEDSWRLISGSLADISEALAVFHPHRATRKITVFGSARTARGEPAYAVAKELAEVAVAQGFEVMTGAGGGVMEAANQGAGCENSIGLNVDLPFEQHANRYVSGCDGRLLHFRYFFTRKLFFLRESDALVVLPGGFGTLDELFESLTLIQTGRTPPIPLVLLAPEGDDFWEGWERHVHEGLAQRGLISPEDSSLLMRARSAHGAIELICRFYRVFHTAQFGADRLELLLHVPFPSSQLGQLNHAFADLLEEGSIQPGESCDDNGILRPCLRLQIDKRRIGRLYQLIDRLNSLELPPCGALEHPGERLCAVEP
ncbi:LOG family protein [Cyanobium sp. Morenito 9A2]|uniref:LOG family protein n=1 Tax=Cyanobium sp. Morenito 9A2 TaxID=2823718 RepID=UPI0020CC1154|nr:LOG family protein [Cyanobium sp. Morenito 9A2]